MRYILFAMGLENQKKLTSFAMDQTLADFIIFNAFHYICMNLPKQYLHRVKFMKEEDKLST